MHCVGVDVGGSGIKAATVDTRSGELVSARVRIPTPADFAFDEVVATIAEVVAASRSDAPAPDAIGIGFPSVVAHGRVLSPPTAHEFDDWVGRDLAAVVAATTGAPVWVGNDADVAGLAEATHGVARGYADGVVVMLTIGTGIGSAVFVDGVLVPNTEFGKLHLAGHEHAAEHYVSDRTRDTEGLSWKEFGRRLGEYLGHLDRLFTPDLVVLGGGVSKKADKYLDQIEIRCPVVPATLRNEAGIIGAADGAASMVAAPGAAEVR